MTFKSTSTGEAPKFVRLLGTLLLAAGALSTVPVSRAGAAAPDFGPNVLIFDPSMPTSQIKATVDAISAQQVHNEFGTQRYALLFLPGTYGSAATPLNFEVGFYTDVAGLGASPDDVIVNGSIDVYNQCGNTGCIALDNFWRSLSNLAVNVNKPNRGCYSNEFWAVSQAAPWRRVHMNGTTTLMDYCTGPSYASGGYIGDSQTGFIIDGSQQQYFVRNSNIGGWSNAIWNQVFAGVLGGPAQTYPNPAYTVLPTTPVSREKPYLYVDAAGNYNVFAPGLRSASVGTSWSTANAPGRSIPIDKFLIAQPSTSISDINDALEEGRNLLLTPGVYQFDRPINVQRPDTVVLGLGLATLVPQTGRPAITVENVDGVQIAGLIIDAGPVNSRVLFEVGRRHGEGEGGDPSDPVALNDVFFRVGGPSAGSATTSLKINYDNVILDDIWAWRADHGTGVGWTLNTADHGLVVSGNNVTALGLAVEHYQKEQVLWNGNGGETIFYQSELPYDVPNQAAWMDGTANGYPSYVVTDAVTTHQVFGSGIYSFFNKGIDIIEDNASTVPVTSGVAVHDTGTVFLNGNGQITHVINGVGGTVSKANPDQLSPVVVYP
jgi:hypothetical protein